MYAAALAPNSLPTSCESFAMLAANSTNANVPDMPLNIQMTPRDVVPADHLDLNASQHGRRSFYNNGQALISSPTSPDVDGVRTILHLSTTPRPKNSLAPCHLLRQSPTSCALHPSLSRPGCNVVAARAEIFAMANYVNRTEPWRRSKRFHRFSRGFWRKSSKNWRPQTCRTARRCAPASSM